MTKKSRKGQKMRRPRRTALTQELCVVAAYDTIDEAKENELLLKNNDIPAMVKQQKDEFSDSLRYAVWVPEDLTDEAHVIIESQDAYDDFYDLSMDEDEEDFDEDIFEEGS